jgi:hypothetical protein
MSSIVFFYDPVHTMLRITESLPQRVPACAVTDFLANLSLVHNMGAGQIESFQTRETAAWYINLLVSYFRHKPYTDCRGSRRHLNAKSRLEATGVAPASKDWLKNPLKSPAKSNRY